jgi:hypothetical protein
MELTQEDNGANYKFNDRLSVHDKSFEQPDPVNHRIVHCSQTMTRCGKYTIYNAIRRPGKPKDLPKHSETAEHANRLPMTSEVSEGENGVEPF